MRVVVGPDEALVVIKVRKALPGPIGECAGRQRAKGVQKK